MQGTWRSWRRRPGRTTGASAWRAWTGGRSPSPTCSSTRPAGRSRRGAYPLWSTHAHRGRPQLLHHRCCVSGASAMCAVLCKGFLLPFCRAVCSSHHWCANARWRLQSSLCLPLASDRPFAVMWELVTVPASTAGHKQLRSMGATPGPNGRLGHGRALTGSQAQHEEAHKPCHASHWEGNHACYPQAWRRRWPCASTSCTSPARPTRATRR